MDLDLAVFSLTPAVAGRYARRMQWIVHGERSVYESEWMCLRLVDVELPDGQRFEHHVLRFPAEASAVVVHDPARGVLLLRRHRFITDTEGWEVPAGRIDDGETPEETARREVLEETGWRPGPLRRLGDYHPSNGSTDQHFHVFVADGAEETGLPPDPNESERVAWLPVDEVHALVTSGAIRDGFSLTSLLWFLADADAAASPPHA